MAWVGPIQSVAFSSTTAAATFTFSPTATMAVGTLVVIGWNVNANQPNATSCADNSTQAGTANVWSLLGGVGGASLGGSSAYCRLTRPILSTDVVTVTLPVATGNRRVGRMLSFTGVVASGTALEQGLNTATQATSPLSIGPTSSAGPISAGGLALAFSYWRGGAVASGFSNSTGGYTAVASTSSGGATSRHEVNAAFKQPTTTASETDVHAFTTVTIVGGQILVFKGAAGTAFAQSVTGAMAFAGSPALSKTSRKFISAEHPTAGAITKSPLARSVTAGFAPASVLARQLSLARTLTAAISSSGSVTAATIRLRSLVGAVFTPTGTSTRVKAVTKALSGALSFTGAQVRVATKLLPATLAPVGILIRAGVMHLPAAILAPAAAALNRFTSHKLTGGLAPTAMVITARGTSFLSAAFHPVAAAVTHGLPARTLFAGFQAAGSLARFTTRRLVSSLIASGVIHTGYLPPEPTPEPGGGGFGAVMDTPFFARYNVDAKWRHMKRVRT